MLDMKVRGRVLTVSNTKDELEVCFNQQGVPIAILFSRLKQTLQGYHRAGARLPHGWHGYTELIPKIEFEAKLRGYTRIVAGDG